MDDVQSGSVLRGALRSDIGVPDRPHGRIWAHARAHGPVLVLCVLMVAFTTWFATYSIRLHDAHLTHKADLGQIDQAIWNTAHGRFLQEMAGENISTRLTDHVEPIFVPVSLVFWLWDDVRALLLLQALALALGAIPIYLLARRRLQRSGYARAAAWGGVVFAAAYLLAPALHAAAVSEFHALALAPALVAWAFWAAESRRWFSFVVAAALLMAVQEGMALLGAALGLFVLVREAVTARRVAAAEPAGERRSFPHGMLVGAAIAVSGFAWFYVTTFVIVPHYARLLYGLNQTPYAARYGELGDSFGDVIKSLVLRPALVARILAEPLRRTYLVKLLAPSGFLALLAPEILILALPLLLANTLSAFPFQYSGELHYSAPLVPYVMVAGAVGLSRLLRWWAGRRPGREDVGGLAATRALGAGLVLVLCGALAAQIWTGYTPAASAFAGRSAVAWPQVTGHDRLLARFVAQVPAGAPLSTTADLYPHVSHRSLLYQFPDVGQAQWALIDVAGTTDRHPAAVRDGVQRLLGRGWGVVDAADGYLLLAEGRGTAELPGAFYAFVRARGDEMAQPQYPLEIMFGNAVELLGYDVVDDPRWRRTSLRFYWRALETLPADLVINVQVLAPDGSVAADTDQVPMVTSLWYPPARWRPGEVVTTETLASYLPLTWAPVVRGTGGGAPLPASGCADAGIGTRDPGADGPECLPDGAARLPASTRRDGRLVLAGTGQPFAGGGARFQGSDWRVALAGYRLPEASAPGSQLPVWLRWAGWDGHMPGPATRDYTVFVHLRDAAGQTVANADATPTYFVPRPANAWREPGLEATPKGWGGTDAHTLALPAGMAPGRYTVVVGWYDLATGRRLQLVDGQGNVTGDEYVLGEVQVDPARAPEPDLACLVAAKACASQ